MNPYPFLVCLAILGFLGVVLYALSQKREVSAEISEKGFRFLAKEPANVKVQKQNRASVPQELQEKGGIIQP